MKILMSGAGGLLGTRIQELAAERGDEVIPLVRRSTKAGERFWNPATGELATDVFDGVDAVIHLAGDNIGNGRWTVAKKKSIRESRVVGTELLARNLAESGRKIPLICASAIGIYGDRGNEELTESSRSGTGFLPEVCASWESAAETARAAGLRVANLRLGIVLSRKGGALASMLFPFQMGVGGNMGDGRQYWSWISLDDAAAAFLEAASNENWRGAINLVAPEPVTNAEFTRVLGRVLRRPTFIPMPAFMAKLALGEMAEALILCSARVLPTALCREKFRYQHTDLESALRAALK